MDTDSVILILAERLSCPHFKTEGCGCLQRYIMANGEFIYLLILEKLYSTSIKH